MKRYIQAKIASYVFFIILLLVLILPKSWWSELGPDWLPGTLFFVSLIVVIFFFIKVKTKPESKKSFDYKQAASPGSFLDKPSKRHWIYIGIGIIAWTGYRLVTKGRIEAIDIIVLVSVLIGYYIYWIYLGNIAGQFRNKVDKDV